MVDYLGILDVLHTLDTDHAAAHAVADLYRQGVPFGVGAAVHGARPTLEWPDGALIATTDPRAYDGLPAAVMDLNQ
ncbi:hypothetical protein ACIREE_39465 [Streptomyces sp. NPDC102467]|uniref:hypothetical protein n=1 Tax=Streptomyces sp. NPDC102467 TaxID=3366179 RepID=UPI003805AA02